MADQIRVFFILHRADLINFESLYFFAFLALSSIAYFLFGRSKTILLLFSILFYAAYSVKMTITVLEISLINYVLGLILSFKKSKLILFAGILLNVGILIYFKYANFFIENVASAGFKEFNTLTHVVIPLGISFFTFELVHYLIDIFKGNKAIYNPISFLNFVLFFPTLFAGPIKPF